MNSPCDPSISFGRMHSLQLLFYVCTTRLIDRTCAELIADGFRVQGRYVGQWMPRADKRIAPIYELLGKVQSQQGIHLFLTDAREGVESVEAQGAVV